MRKREGPIYEAANKREKLLRAYGVPSRYLRYTTDEYQAHFRKAADPATKRNLAQLESWTYDRDWVKNAVPMNVTMDKQKQVLSAIFEDKALAETSMVVGAGTYPTDHLGLMFGAAVCRRAMDLKLRPRMINSRRSPASVVDTPDVVVLYNTAFDCDPIRATMCRDWINHFDDVFTVVITAGTDPVTFFHTRLHLHVDAALNFRGD